ncbi:MAG: HD domain-containing phosphohydrolase [Gemmatimonadota bacterium]
MLNKTDHISLSPSSAPERTEDYVAMAREHERAGRVDEAIRDYSSALLVVREDTSPAIQSEALRRLGVIRHQRHEPETARMLCRLSREVASKARLPIHAAEALNAIAAFELEAGAFDSARCHFMEALRLGASDPHVRGRIEQNLGILANIQGSLPMALEHYERSLEAFRASGDERGCAIAYHNLGMISADQSLLDSATTYFQKSMEIAEQIGDVQLRGLCLLNQTEVLIARQRFEEARESAQAALQIFDQLGAIDGKAAAYRFLGMIYRETGSLTLAESRLQSAMALALETGSPLEEAEASRELALTYQLTGRSRDALTHLNRAHRIFERLEASLDLGDIAAKVVSLESTFRAIIRDWGRSIESADTYTYGHCERVADHAVAVAQALGLDDDVQATLRLGAYLHDLGKVRIPLEILNKPSRLTNEEYAIMQQHPVYGLEMLAAIEFPWDIKPIIRSHHEKYDGTGYPDGLKGDEIPLTAQIVCIVDVYDALTTDRSYRAGMSHDVALKEIARSRHWWHPDVFAAFHEAVVTFDVGLTRGAGPAGTPGF